MTWGPMVGFGQGQRAPPHSNLQLLARPQGISSRDCRQQFGLGHFEVLSLVWREAVIISLSLLWEACPQSWMTYTTTSSKGLPSWLHVLSNYYLLGTPAPSPALSSAFPCAAHADLEIQVCTTTSGLLDTFLCAF